MDSNILKSSLSSQKTMRLVIKFPSRDDQNAVVLNTLSMEQEVNEIVCFTVKQEELTKEVTAAFERGSYSI